MADPEVPRGSYTEAYYRWLREGARRSAEEVVPLALDLIRPASVVDVGCGRGTWLAVFRELGIEDVLGIDGDHVDPANLEIPADRFLAADLTRPLRLDREFDLVLSLEVAEHLLEEFASVFVGSLAGLGPVVLFSAAIPFQGGEGHVNEQWPEYWVRHFGDHGYTVVDCLRRRVWGNERVEWWYAQNMLVFARPDRLESLPALKDEAELTDLRLLSLVHPRKYLELHRDEGGEKS